MKILKLVSLIILMTACSSPPNHQSASVYVCDELPSEIPKVWPSGDSVTWDCQWNDSYKAGEVTVIFDSTGNLKYLFRKMATGEYERLLEAGAVEASPF